jgi:asparagine synthase (glutamine-hydrolysing)
LPAIAAALDDPVADYAIVPSALLARAAAPELTVVLTGEGGDEIFAGYGRYRAACRPWPFAKKMWARSHLSASGVLRQSSKTWRADIQETEVNLSRTSGSRLQKAQLLDVAHWLPHDLLTKVDRCLMAYGLEGRVPFLDDSVAEFGLNLADSDKVRGRYGKWIVRKWLERTLPAAQPFARKRGFSVPVAEWIASAGPHLGTLVAQQAGVIQSCAPDRVERLFESVTKRTGQAAWILLFYALWHQCHIVGRSAGEDIFSVLAET